ncbi:putative ABC transport system ATP-binding protein [Tessaracoccus bendigoensis DSM 12906]|uniref:Putative ABC transport system ATP-binding protein n=1 Tax=Tessaracoccus bendigoensis DSM 12906 TaxID=1123357 RepID=A0A1M6NEM7_9ACTN|nr:ABC transporter ATP-binding protein [Tessaracoccus bendigoensis]SHJ94137.1 putative ABC transport system ATP-binding protein [Tessaracoccus bendigoensis DSM 12906]
MTTPVISLREVSVTYPGPPPVHALVGANVAILPGEYVTVVGPSGSGKSTFLNIVGLLDEPTSGTYELNGSDTSTLTEKERTGLRGHDIGFVFQSFHLLNYRSAVENVELALLYNSTDPSRRTELALSALHQVGLDHRVNSLPNQLSGGERQRVAIARAIVGNPSVVLCDEPTGNLDSRTAKDVLDILRDLHQQGLTIIVITHDPGVAAQGRRTLRITDGHLREESA